ncbi:hypothetical protein H5410_020846, partial [Solanum commersonii]
MTSAIRRSSFFRSFSFLCSFFLNCVHVFVSKSKYLKLNFYIKNLILNEYLLFLKICSTVDHSATLVEIVDQLGDSPFGVVHRRLALSFNIVVFWIIRRPSTTSQNFSTTRQLLLFTADLILSFRVQYTRTKGEVRSFGDMPNGFGDPQIFVSPFFQLPLFLFAQLCPYLCLQ